MKQNEYPISRRPFSLEDEGKAYFIDYLRRLGFTNIFNTNFRDKKEHWDLEADYNGDHFYFELKNRQCPSTKWGDTEINTDKYEFLCKLPGKVMLVTFFEDVWNILDIKANTPRKYSKWAETSHYNFMCKTQKDFVNWRLDVGKTMKYKLYNDTYDC